MSVKKVFNFRLIGVIPRDAALFASYVRVLDFRLEHKWQYQDSDAHLIIYGSPSTQIQSVEIQDEFVHALCFSASETGENFLRLPLNSAEIEAALNRIGNLINLRQDQQNTSAINPEQSYRLKRWPPAGLLNTSDRIRFATLLTKRVLSVSKLHTHTGLALEKCRLFVEELLSNDLLEEVAAEVEKSLDPQSKRIEQDKGISRSGLISLIRSNLSRFAK